MIETGSPAGLPALLGDSGISQPRGVGGVLPVDAAPIWGRWMEWFSHYIKVPYSEAVVIARRHSVMCSPLEDRVLFPYYRYGPDSDSSELAVWARAIPPYYSMRGGKRPRYYLYPEPPRLLWEACPPSSWGRLFITEGAADAIKLTEFTDDYAVATYGTHCSQDCLDRIREICPDKTWERVVVYDTGAELLAAENARLLGGARVVRFPHGDPGAATPEQIQEWYATNFS